MAIRFHQGAKEFHLFNEKISYVMKVLESQAFDGLSEEEQHVFLQLFQRIYQNTI